MIDDINDATHYSKSMDAYFHFDNAAFIWCDELERWIEYYAIRCIKDLEELK